MNIYKNLSRTDDIKYMFYKHSKETIKTISESFGFDISYFISDNYELRQKSNLYSKEKAQELVKVKDAIDYNGSQAMHSIGHLINAIRDYRAKAKKGSIGTDDYMKKFDLYKVSAERTKKMSAHWWQENNPRTYIDIKSERNIDNGVVKGQSTYSRTEISVNPLWYHKVYKHGLHGVQYKGRPCFVISVVPNPIRRLEEDNIDVHKATILHSHGGDITMHSDMWLASFKQSDYEVDKVGKVIRPSERILSVSPDLRRAETNVSQRIGRNVIGSLLS